MPGYNDLIINTDGSAITNPGSCVVCAGVITYPEYCNLEPEEISWSYNVGTSNDMEIASIVNALKWINTNSGSYAKVSNP